ncbi:cellulose biosynthesis protein BcsQ [Erythromicrobium ramosum]|jgi:chromosome partitioning protein|uniref:AAA family ATPase n=1 Tax=Erythrobacter ramosus TaxID=35811 RepID=A0A6I4UHB3_9SPHN|nr:ParA family protein [Erythrobacter ramosus]MBB3775108.1 cellulose biosynthesis protein BcsQ [Erythrobacter ramosus]MXP37264.1 AAA family ATPase [Erythrobacter ramosus]
MASIAVYSVKGGVGKTTLAVNLAWCSASISRRKTLLWDLDAANGSGFLLGVDPKKKRSADSMFAEGSDPAKLIQPTAFPGLDLLPADESIRAIDRTLDRMGKKKRLAKLTAALGKDYDRIIFDCPPVLNELSAQIIRAADLIIVPLPPSPLSARAFEVVVEEVRGAGKGHPPILPVLAMLDLRRSLHKEAREANPNWPAIPLASAVEQCAVERKPVGAFAPRSPAARAIAQLWTAIERKLAEK